MKKILRNRPVIITTVILIINIYLSLFTGCKTKALLPEVADSVTIPCQEATNSTFFCYRGKLLLWKLISDYSWKPLNDTGTTLVVPVRQFIFDSLGHVATYILSDSGTTDKKMEKFFLWGNVFIKRHDGLIIKSKSFWWSKKTAKVGSDDFVEIKTPDGDILRGKGLDADENFTWWTLRENVSGEFPNFKDHIEEEENIDELEEKGETIEEKEIIKEEIDNEEKKEESINKKDKNEEEIDENKKKKEVIDEKEKKEEKIDEGKKK